MKKKIVLTGGHAGSTAYSVVQALKKSVVDWEISFIGTKYAIEGKDTKTFEYSVFPKIGVKFYPIVTGRVQRRFSKWTLLSLLKIPVGILYAFKVLTTVKPDIVMSFGGFAAYPVVLASWFYRIPVVIHEQTAAVGRANRYSSFFACKILLARKESEKYFKKDKLEVVGNPISEEILKIRPKATGYKSTLLITGGSRGSVVVNELVEEVLEDILRKYHVIHQVGADNLERYEKTKNSLPKELRDKYQVLGFVDPRKWWEVLDASDAAVSRAGANSVSEFIATKRPSLLIPIPWSYLNEQVLNAKNAQKHHLAIILEQEGLKAKTLLESIQKLMVEKGDMVKKALDEGYDPDRTAQIRIVKILEDLVS